MVALGRFDGLYGQDPFAYYDYATGPLRQSLLHLVPPPPFFWPPGYPLLVVLTSLAVGATPLAGQLVSLVAGGLVPVFTALLAREVWEPNGGDGGKSVASVPLVAGLVAAFSGQLWQSSAVVMADTTGLAAATLGVWSLARYGRRRHLDWLILAAIALAWAVLTRWIYALLALLCTVYAIIIFYRGNSRTALVHGAVAVLVTSLILGPLLAPAVRALLDQNEGLAPFAGNLQVYSWHPLRALRREFITVDGLLRYRLPNGLYYALAPAHRFYFTPLLALLILPGLWAVVRRRTLELLCLIVGWAAVVYGFHAGAPWQNFRFTLAYLPPLAVLVGIGMDAIHRMGRGHLRWLPRVYLALGLVAMAAGGLQLTQSFIERKQAHLAMVRWVESQTPPNARLLTFGLTLTFRHYSYLETLELFELMPAEIDALFVEGRPMFLLIDVLNVEGQWKGLAPETNYRWLQKSPGLERLGIQGDYTLFRVERVVEESNRRDSTCPLAECEKGWSS
jgi:4-amino-4-deoxy-L-arabinose transferase-like glycosyltransferase